jgi:hypothetical protein
MVEDKEDYCDTQVGIAKHGKRNERGSNNTEPVK